MSIKESEIRACVAKNLEFFDKTLQLIREEHSIKFYDGRSAFVNILAKDRFGCYTIIEIKKSNQTARSAIQQLYKYASFLKEKNRLETSQIRCIVISTVWDELNAPFSEFKNFSDYDVKGYQLNYSPDSVPNFNEVFPEFITGNNKPLSSFYFFTFKNKALRDRNINFLESLLKLIPSINYVLFSLNLIEGKENIASSYAFDEYPFGIAWVVFTGNVKGIESELFKIEKDNPIEAPDLDV